MDVKVTPKQIIEKDPQLMMDVLKALEIKEDIASLKTAIVWQAIGAIIFYVTYFYGNLVSPIKQLISVSFIGFAGLGLINVILLYLEKNYYNSIIDSVYTNLMEYESDENTRE